MLYKIIHDILIDKIENNQYIIGSRSLHEMLNTARITVLFCCEVRRISYGLKKSVDY